MVLIVLSFSYFVIVDVPIAMFITFMIFFFLWEGQNLFWNHEFLKARSDRS